MTLTKKQREWLRDVKERCEKDWKIQFENIPIHLKYGHEEGFKDWEAWRLADLCEKLSKGDSK